jgi:hypothetical protein
MFKSFESYQPPPDFFPLPPQLPERLELDDGRDELEERLDELLDHERLERLLELEELDLAEPPHQLPPEEPEFPQGLD